MALWRLLLPLGLLYYAGHGYENFGNSFMVPVDAPNPYRSGNCLCVQSILKLMQEKETGLNVFLLDMCRKRCEFKSYSHWFKTIHTLFVIILMLIYCFRNVHDDATPNVVLKVTANIVFGYATWVTECLSISSRTNVLQYILFSGWYVMLIYIMFVKLPRCWGFWTEFKWIHQWSLY